jgi:hypothetical protein
MNHLTDDQLAEWLAGESTEETRTHLADCPLCHREALALRDDISRYSIALRDRAQQSQGAHLEKNFTPQRALAAHRLRWAGAMALALLLAAPTAWMLKPHTAPAPLPPVAGAPRVAQPSAAMSDDELLEAVNNDLNREVPQALAPVGAITVARNNKIAAASSGTARNLENASTTDDSVK